MVRRSEAFGRLLKAGISSIAYVEGKTAPVVEEELGSQVGVTSFTIQRYKAGNIPREPDTVRVLAEACVQRGLLGRPWLERFLQAARFSEAEAVLEQLFSAPSRLPLSSATNELLPPSAATPAIAGRAGDAPTLARFVGRATELAALEARLQRERLVIITGMPGVGKTALMAALAARVTRPERICWYRCHQDDDADTLVRALAAFLAWRGQPGPWALLQEARRADGRELPDDLLSDYVLHLLREGRYLLCVDDVHLADEDPRFAQFIEQLRGAEEIAVILSSRRTPSFARLSEVDVLPGLSPVDAGGLLVARGVALSAEADAQLYAQTQGNAQLLILALDALARSRDPEGVVRDLAQANDVERYLLREVDAGLSDAERLVMRVVAALLEDGGTRKAVAALLDTSLDEAAPSTVPTLADEQLQLDPRRLRAALVSLCDRCLLAQDEGAGEYIQHAVVGSFYYAELSRHERQTLHRRAGAYYEAIERRPLKAALQYEAAGDILRAVDLATADVWPLISTGQAQRLRSLLERLDSAHLDPPRQLLLSRTLGEVCVALRARDAARHHFEQALQLAPAQPKDADGQHLLAQICRGMGELLEPEDAEAAVQWLQRGREALGGADAREEARLLIRISSAEISRANWDAARTTLERSLQILPTDAETLRADVLLNLGTIFGRTGDLTRATASLLDALAIYERAGDRWCEAIVRQSLGMALTLQGNWPAAADEYRRALAIAERLGSPARLAELMNNLGWLRLRQGNYPEARALLDQSAALARHHHLAEHLVYVSTNLAALAIAENRWDHADVAVGQAEALALELGIRGELPEIYRGKALVSLAQAAPEQARAFATRALELARELEDPVAEGVCLRVLAQVLRVSGDADGSQEAFGASEQLLEEEPYEQARTRAVWGQALLARDAPRAIPLLQQARSTFALLGADGDLAALPQLERRHS